MPQMLDMGLVRLKENLQGMANLSEEMVSESLEAFAHGKDVKDLMLRGSDQLRDMQDELNDLSVELLARFGPVASDLRRIKSYLEASYDFSRFGRYAYDISQVLSVFGDLTACGIYTRSVIRAGEQTKKMIRISTKALMEQDLGLGEKVRTMDDFVDRLDLDHMQAIANTQQQGDSRCSVSAALILRYLERIADHTTSIADAVLFMVSGQRATRKDPKVIYLGS